MQCVDVETGFLAHPDDGARGGVVVVHDVWGLSDHTRDICRRLAGEGFAALGVDLYRREQSVEIGDPGAWIRALSDPQVLSDVGEAAAVLAAHPAVGGGRVGVVGFCMGGMYALMAGCGVPGVSAVVPFYGMLSHDHGMLHDPAGADPARKPRSPLDAARELACPLLAFFGADDPFIPVADVRELEQRLAKRGAAAEVVLVEGAGHAFMNDTRPDAYREAAAADAWARMTAFLRENLAR